MVNTRMSSATSDLPSRYIKDCFISEIGKTVLVPGAFLHPVLIGDQLTAARRRGAKKAKVHADSPTSRLEGLILVAED